MAMEPIPSIFESSLNSILLDAGFERLYECVYKAIWSTEDIEHFIYVYKDLKRGHMLVGDFGIKNKLLKFLAAMLFALMVARSSNHLNVLSSRAV
jgi:hypothetical protein